HINKALKIFSSGGCTNTHIFGDVSVTADDVTLQGITFYSSTESFSTLKIYNSFTTIVNCRFVENLESTALYSPVPSMAIDCESCPHLHIVNNDFYGWKHAVLVKTTDSLVIQTNTFRFCHSAVLILTEGACNVWGNLFKNNIIGIQSPIMALTEKFLNNNDFSGNVIPLLGNGSFVSYPPLHTKYSEPVQTSNIFYVTGECNVENTSLPPYENCAKFETGSIPKAVDAVEAGQDQEVVQEFYLPEDAQPGHLIGTVKCRSRGVRFSITDTQVRDVFSVHQESGKLYLLRPVLDFELVPEYSFSVVFGFPQNGMHKTTNVRIVVLDVNDEKPVFEHDIYRANITQLAQSGSKLVQISVHDKDQGDTLSLDLIAYSVHSLGLFSIDQSSRHISTARQVVVDDLGRHDMIVIASDRGGLVAYALVVINIENTPNPPFGVLDVYHGYLVVYSSQFYGVIGQLDTASNQAITECGIRGPMHAAFHLDQNWNIWQIGEVNPNGGRLSIICSDHTRVNAVYVYSLFLDYYSHSISRRQS
ncbi:Protein dachsous, partial [Geodia barretti]